MSALMLDLDSSGWFVLTGSPRFKDLINQIPGFTYDSKSGGWHARPSWSVAVAARGILGDHMDITEPVRQWADAQRARIGAAYTYRNGAWVLPCVQDLGLYNFQEHGSTFLAMVETALMADEMGTGKTVQASVALKCLRTLAEAGHRPSPLPALVVCTTSMKGKWTEELAKWAGLKAIATGDTKKKRLDAIAAVAAGEYDVLVTNWNALALHSRLAPYGSIAMTEQQKTPAELNHIQWQAVVADEAHKAKDPKTNWTRALWQLGDQATYRWALTGTPISGLAEDLWSIMRFVEPREYPIRSRFIDRYALAGTNHWGGFETYGFNPAHEAELHAFLDPRLIRRTKAEVLPELPPKTFELRKVVMGTKQAKAYKDMKKELLYIDEETGEILMAADDLSSNGRLSQISSAMPILETVQVLNLQTNELVDVVKVIGLQMPSAKVDALKDMLEESDEPLVVGAESRLLLELVAEELTKKKITHCLITGAVVGAARDIAVAEFQAGVHQVALVSLGAGAEGITLTRARRLVVLQASHKMTANLQFVDRIHRIGQTADSLEIIFVVTEGTVDEDRLDNSNAKELVMQQVVRDEGWEALAPVA